MKIVHISDTHGGHEKLTIPTCDVLCFTGDLGGRTNLYELNLFLMWFEKQPASRKIFIAGNHDIVLDKAFPFHVYQIGRLDSVAKDIMLQQHGDALDLIDKYSVTYLKDREFIYEGVKFYGSPYSPSFHRDNWAFNADRGQEIRTIWGKIPSDVNVLMTHSPVYDVLDDLGEYARAGEDTHAGCIDLMGVITKRLHDLKIHMCGHIHDNYGVVQRQVSRTRRVLFSNGAVISTRHEQLITKPIIIEI